jgi:hypothetical protein
MDTQLSHEMMLLQQSRCNQKYQEIMNDLPGALNKSLAKPMNKFNKTISRLVKNRGRMLLMLDRYLLKRLNYTKTS